MKRIVSRNNPRFKLLRRLAGSAHERRRQRQTVLDGAHLIRAYLEYVGKPLIVAVSEPQRDRPEIHDLLARLGDMETYCLSAELFAQITPVEHPTGIIAIIGVPSAEASRVSSGLMVVLDRVQDPGNVGTIIRSSAGAGADAVLLCSGSADPWSPRALRAAMGATFAIDVRPDADLASAIASFRGRVIATAAQGGQPPYAADLTGPAALLVGSEGSGLSAALAAVATTTLSIPLARGIESLSVGAAAAIILFERARQIAIRRG